MATYRIEAPDGGTYRLEGPDGATNDELVAALLQKYPNAGQAPKDTSGFTAAFSSGIDRLLGEASLTAGKAGLLDAEQAQRNYRARQHAAETRFKPTEAGWTEDPLLKLRELAGGSAAYMGIPAAAGLAALALPASAPAAAIGAGLAGLASFGQFTGTNLSRQLDEGKSFEEASLGKAAAAAVPQAALDVGAMILLPGVGKLFGDAGVKLSKEAARQIATQTFKQAALDYTAKTGMAMGREGITEAAQQALERLQAGLSLTDPEARQEYIDNFIGGAALAGVMAPAGRAVERAGIKSDVRKEQQAEAAAAQRAVAPSAEEATAGRVGKVNALRTSLNDAMTQIRAATEAGDAAKITELADQIATIQGELSGLQKYDAAHINEQLDKLTAQQAKAVEKNDMQRAARLGRTMQELTQQLSAIGGERVVPETTVKKPVVPIEAITERGEKAEEPPEAKAGTEVVAPSGTATEASAAVEEPTVAPPQDEGAAALKRLQDQAAEAAGEITGFTTAKGSVYALDADGRTTRNKAARPEHPGEEGPQPQSERTVYVSPDDVGNLDLLQAQGETQYGLAFDSATNRVAAKALNGPDKGKLIDGTVTSFSTTPEVGLIPVEYWGDNKTVHFGNPITDITRAQVTVPETEAPALPTTSEKPSVEDTADALADRLSEKVGEKLDTQRVKKVKEDVSGELTIDQSPFAPAEEAPAPTAKRVKKAAPPTAEPLPLRGEALFDDYAQFEAFMRGDELSQLRNELRAKGAAIPEGETAARERAALADTQKEIQQLQIQVRQLGQQREALRGKGEEQRAVAQQKLDAAQEAVTAAGNRLFGRLATQDARTGARRAQREQKRQYKTESLAQSTYMQDAQQRVATAETELDKTLRKANAAVSDVNAQIAPLTEKLKGLTRRVRSVESKIKERASAPQREARRQERAQAAVEREAKEKRTIAEIKEENARMERLADLPTVRYSFEKDRQSSESINKKVVELHKLTKAVLPLSQSEATRRDAERQIAALRKGLVERFGDTEATQLEALYSRANNDTLTPEARSRARIAYENKVVELKRQEAVQRPAMQKAMAGMANAMSEYNKRREHVEQLLADVDKLPPSKAAKKGNTIAKELVKLDALEQEMAQRGDALARQMGVTAIKKLTREERNALLRETGQLFYGMPKKVKGVDLENISEDAFIEIFGKYLRTQLWEHNAAPLMYSTKFAVAMRTGSPESKEGANRGGTQYGARQARGRTKRAPFRSAEAYQANIDAYSLTGKTPKERVAYVEEVAQRKKADKEAQEQLQREIEEAIAIEDAAAKYGAKTAGIGVGTDEAVSELVARKKQEAGVEDDAYAEALDERYDDELPDSILDQLEGDRYFRENNALYDVAPTNELTAEGKKAARDGRLLDALFDIETTSASEFNRELAGVLQNYVQDTTLSVDKKVTHDGERVDGAYTPKENHIALDAEALAEEPLLHEATHAATLEALTADAESLTPKQREARAEVESVYNRIRKDKAFEREYGAKSLPEFAAEVMTNKRLRDKLDRVPNLFRRFMDAVLRMLGVSRQTLSQATVGNIYAMFKPSRRIAAEPQPSMGAVAATMRGVFPATGPEAAGWVPSDVVGITDSLIAKQATLGDRITANITGMRLRTKLIDRFAPIEWLRKQGVAAGVLDEAQAWTVLAAMRINEQRTQLVGTAASDGVPQMQKDLDAEGRGTGAHYITGRAGANLHKVHEALSKANVGNEQFTEQLFTSWLAVLRAERAGVGYDKLNFGVDENGRPLMDANIARQIKNTVAQDPQTKAAFEEARAIYKEYNSDLLQLLVDTGVMDEEKASELLDGDYVPYFRVENGLINLHVPGSKPFNIGSIVDQPYMQELIGGNDKILPFFSGALQNTAMLIESALRNTQTKEIAYMLQKMGLGTIKQGGGGKGIDVIRFKQSGETYHLRMNVEAFPKHIPADLVVQGMQGIKTAVPQIVRMMAIPGDILRKSVTRMPTYALRQLIRDPMHAWLTTGGNFTPVASSIKQLTKMVGKEDETELSLQRAGVISSNVYAGDTRDTAMLLRNISKGGPKLGTLLAKWDALVLQGDASTRAVLYNKYREQGMSHLQASLGALESMNFSRRGTSASIHWLSTMIPFFNAQIQGLDAIWRAATGDTVFEDKLNVRAKMFARGMMLAAASTAYALLMSDDDAYKNATEDERAASWFLRLPGTTETIRVPKPFELGFVFATLPELFINTAFGDTKAEDAVKAMANQLRMSVPGATNMFLPAGAKPVIELAANTNFFTMSPIDSQREQSLLPEERARAGTTEGAKLLAKALGVSPNAIEHLVRGYTSSMGMLLLSLPNMVLRPLTSPESGEPVEKTLSEMPMFSTLFQPADGRGAINAAFSEVERFQQAHATFNALVTSGRTEEAEKFAEKHANELAMASVGGGFRQQMGEFAKIRRMVLADATMSGAEKRQMVKEIRQVEIELARAVREMASQ